MTGGIGTAAQYVVLVGGVRISGMPVFWSSLGAVAGAIINYLINYHYTFESSRPHLDTTYKFLSVAAVGFLLNAAMMSFCVHFLGLYYIFSQLLSTGLVLVWGFLANLTWTFR
jgi:putative flippase GtrA